MEAANVFFGHLFHVGMIINSITTLMYHRALSI